MSEEKKEEIMNEAKLKEREVTILALGYRSLESASLTLNWIAGPWLDDATREKMSLLGELLSHSRILLGEVLDSSHDPHWAEEYGAARSTIIDDDGTTRLRTSADLEADYEAEE